MIRIKGSLIDIASPSDDKDARQPSSRFHIVLLEETKKSSISIRMVIVLMKDEHSSDPDLTRISGLKVNALSFPDHASFVIVRKKN